MAKETTVMEVSTRNSGELQNYVNEQFGEIRGMMIDGEPWFVGKDVATALGYKDTVNALKSHVRDNHKKGWQITTPSRGIQTMTLIDEAGLYSLIMRSKLPAAEDFQEWVTSEVLPSIRKTGSYSNKPMSALEMFGLAYQAACEHERALQQQQAQLIKQEQQISNIQQKLNDSIHVTAHNDLILDCTNKLQQIQLDKHEEDIRDIQQVVFNPSPREELSTFVKDAVAKYQNIDDPPTYQSVYLQVYNDLRKMTGANLNLRLTKLKKRLEQQGASKTKISKASILDVIEQDQKLWEPLREIIKEYREQYNI